MTTSGETGPLYYFWNFLRVRFYLYFFILKICLLILEREEGRERSIDVRVKHRLVASHALPMQDEPTTLWHMKRQTTEPHRQGPMSLS